ncbi:tetratricopeptide repeat protein [Shimazuella soli]|uniref:tetratricopeptide repeat protein n=1 Tax=Shimazuella soli TaxID=1892854 RepID=UPI001F10E1AA|nr:hypothetical protein [Shimazuella soli]
MGTFAPFAYYLWGKCYFEKKKWSQAEKFLRDVITLIEEQYEENHELKKSNILAGCLNDLARIAFFQSDFKRALQYVENGLQSFVDQGDRLYLKYFLLLNKCVYLEKMNNDKVNNQEKIIVSLEKLQKSISAFEKTEDMFQLVRLSVIIQYYEMYANVWNNIGMTEKAYELAQKGINIAWLNLEFDRLLTLWNTMGNIFLNKGNIQKAKEYFLLALDIQSKIKREYLLIPTYMNVRMLYLRENDPTTANIYLEKALFISKKNGDAIGQIKALQAKGRVSISQNAYMDAISSFEKGYELAKHHKFLFLELEIMDNICTCYKKLDQKDEFLTCVEKTYLIRQQIKEKEEGGLLENV